MTASTKPEVHNASQRRRRRTQPRPQATRTKIWWSSAVCFWVTWADVQTDRQTDRQLIANVLTARITVVHGSFNRICHVAPICTSSLYMVILVYTSLLPKRRHLMAYGREVV